MGRGAAKSSTATVGSLFSGIGGFDLGLERAGMTVAWQCEKDDAARRVLDRRWPDVPCYPDVKDLDGREPRVDVLCGGFPCQDLSVAGRRAGLAGERSGLFHEFMRVAAELAPRWVLVENVPGLLSSNDGRDMGVVLGVLADLGYGWCYRVLDAQFFGVAQRRRRVFIVGCLGDAGRAAEVLFESDCCDGDPAPSREAGPGTSVGTLGGTSPGGGWRFGADEAAAGQLIPAALTGNGIGVSGPDDNQAQAGHPIAALTSPCGNTLDDQQTGQLLPISVDRGSDTLYAHDLAQPITGRHADPGHVAYPLAVRGRDDGQEWELGEPGLHNALRAGGKPGDGSSSHNWVMSVAENQRGEVLETEYAHQLTSGKPGQGYPAVRDGMAVRRLMPVECERLQGFPDHWTADESDSARYRMLGNAVCVPVAHWIGHRIAEAA